MCEIPASTGRETSRFRAHLSIKLSPLSSNLPRFGERSDGPDTRVIWTKHERRNKASTLDLFCETTTPTRKARCRHKTTTTAPDALCGPRKSVGTNRKKKKRKNTAVLFKALVKAENTVCTRQARGRIELSTDACIRNRRSRFNSALLSRINFSDLVDTLSPGPKNETHSTACTSGDRTHAPLVTKREWY